MADWVYAVNICNYTPFDATRRPVEAEYCDFNLCYPQQKIIDSFRAEGGYIANSSSSWLMQHVTLIKRLHTDSKVKEVRKLKACPPLHLPQPCALCQLTETPGFKRQVSAFNGSSSIF
ncbi:hypothetical protein NQZ68_029302 [Dissostichus eleginoides]|nr:hypothetical protein NQZ68_029302 [Dissostichus eleginoides]